MRKFFLLILGVVLFLVLVFTSSRGLFAYAFEYLPARSGTVQLSGFKTHHSKKLGIKFDYPEILKVREKDGVVTIEHSVSFEHRNPCDGNGLQPRLKKIFDFYAKIVFLPLTPTEVFRQEVMERNKNEEVIGVKNTFRVTYGKLDGFRVYNGNHGCGPYSYFFQLSSEKVLRVDRWPASEFREVPESEKQMYSRLRQIILPEQERHIFEEILYSLTMESK